MSDRLQPRETIPNAAGSAVSGSSPVPPPPVPLPLPDGVRQWSSRDVCSWLKSLRLAHWCRQFKAAHIDGVALLKLTDMELVEELHVECVNERTAILAARDELRAADHNRKPRSEDDTQAGVEASTGQDARNFGYFHVNVLQGSPDPCSRVESAIAELSCKLRAKPTIPASPSCPQQPQQEALREDTAVLLPALHCAFQQCTWSGISEACLMTHLKAKPAK